MSQFVASLNLESNIIRNLNAKGILLCSDSNDDIKKVADFSAPATKSALELYKRRFDSVFTFIPELNRLLEGQIVPCLITELCGGSGSGKTQICFQLCLKLAVEARNSFFVSTDKSFASHRIKEIAQQNCGNLEGILERIHCLEASDSLKLLASINILENFLKEQNVRIVIIDSIFWPLKQLPSGERRSVVYTIFQKLRSLSNTHHFSIVVTNNLTSTFANNTTRQISSFGDSFFHCVNNRILLSKIHHSFRAKIIKSVNFPETDQVDFQI